MDVTFTEMTNGSVSLCLFKSCSPFYVNIVKLVRSACNQIKSAVQFYYLFSSQKKNICRPTRVLVVCVLLL